MTTATIAERAVRPGDTLTFKTRPAGHWLIRAVTTKGGYAVATSMDNPVTPIMLDAAVFDLVNDAHYIPVTNRPTTVGGHDNKVDTLTAALNVGNMSDLYPVRQGTEIATINGAAV